MIRTCILVILLASVASLVASASPPSFCKCTCFSNSTIIPLGKYKDVSSRSTSSKLRLADSGATGFGSHDGDSSLASDAPRGANARTRAESFPAADDKVDEDRDQVETAFLRKRVASSSCAQCNRAYCLANNLPNCKGAEEKDVVTSCFQRDSRKDQIIVWGFIVGTAGLLGWAGLRRILESRDGGKVPLGGVLPLGIPGANGRARTGAGNDGNLARRPAPGISRASRQPPPFGIGGTAGARDGRSRAAYNPLEISDGVAGPDS